MVLNYEFKTTNIWNSSNDKLECLKIRSFEKTMSDNEFQYLSDYININELEQVILVNNVQTSIPKSIFINISSITYLMLEFDNLMKIEKGNFENLNNLKRLNIDSSRLSA